MIQKISGNCAQYSRSQGISGCSRVVLHIVETTVVLGRQMVNLLEGKLSSIRAIFCQSYNQEQHLFIWFVLQESVFLPCGSGGLLFGIDGEAKQVDNVYHGLFHVLPKSV